MFGDGALAFQEFVMGESLPLATIHAAVLELLRGRDDAVLFGAQAVNAYVGEPRMTQDVDVLSTRPTDLVEELREQLSQRFHIALRTREGARGRGIRLYQVRQPMNRHLVDVRGVSELPPHQVIDGVKVLAPSELVAYKVMSFASRRATAKGAMDLADLRRLLMTFPALKQTRGDVLDRLIALGAPDAASSTWNELAIAQIEPDDDDE